jgi:hypothetical protein
MAGYCGVKAGGCDLACPNLDVAPVRYRRGDIGQPEITATLSTKLVTEELGT